MALSLVVLAAGIGSRYGGIKQIDGVGPSNEIILDYSVYDAVNAGFDKMVFIIRHAIEKPFVENVIPRFPKDIKIELVYQELDYLPSGFELPSDRQKPWGTAHAMLQAKSVVNEPFAVINADDFYGKSAFVAMASYLNSVDNNSLQSAMVAYQLEKTLSLYGSVSRGICKSSEDDFLVSIEEHLKIVKEDDVIRSIKESGSEELASVTDTSMNLFGFTSPVFDEVERGFTEFLKDNIEKPKAEYFIPLIVNELLNSGKMKQKVLRSDAQWYGMTYPEDKPYSTLR